GPTRDCEGNVPVAVHDHVRGSHGQSGAGRQPKQDRRPATETVVPSRVAVVTAGSSRSESCCSLPKQTPTNTPAKHTLSPAGRMPTGEGGAVVRLVQGARTPALRRAH
ncbi:jg26213, partial [Pararge aegeria aegeria]